MCHRFYARFVLFPLTLLSPLVSSSHAAICVFFPAHHFHVMFLGAVFSFSLPTPIICVACSSTSAVPSCSTTSSDRMCVCVCVCVCFRLSQRPRALCGSRGRARHLRALQHGPGARCCGFKVFVCLRGGLQAAGLSSVSACYDICLIILIYHTHTYTYAHTHTYTHTHIYTHTHTHAYAHMVANVYQYAHAHTHTHTHTRSHACIGICAYVSIHFTALVWLLFVLSQSD